MLPRYAVVVMLAVGLLLAWLIKGVPMGDVRATLARPALTWPRFSAPALAGLAPPLILTTLMGQFLPGTAILRANGYDVAARPVVALWALASLPSGLLGGSPRRPPGHGHRYAAVGACGAFFLLDRLLAGTIAQLLKHLPVAVIALLAGLALLGAIMKSLAERCSPRAARPTGRRGFSPSW
nr:benzoate/H(+) symporter BenE family transporter [Paracoccus sp. MC1862]